MRAVRAFSLAVGVVAAAWGHVAAAQVGGPREAPPADFAGNQYVDSSGCVFLRAEVDGKVTWVPRLSRDRKPVCGMEPSLSQGAAPAPQTAEPAESPQPVNPAPATAPAPQAEPAVTAERPAGTRRVQAARGDGLVRIARAGAIAADRTYCPGRVEAARRYLLTDGVRVTRCSSEAAADPVAYLNGLGVPGLRVAPGRPSAAEIRRAEKANAGAYRVVWSNGNLSASGETARNAPSPTASGSRPMVATGNRYVQAGAFADPANADRSVARIKALGLPVTLAPEAKAGQRLRTVLAGPFASETDLYAALRLLKLNGYPDAYLRR